MIRLVPADDCECDECGSLDGVQVLVVGQEVLSTTALCTQCMIKTEAVLRGARKSGPPVGKWGQQGPPNSTQEK